MPFYFDTESFRNFQTKNLAKRKAPPETIGLGLTSHWLRKLRELYQPITESS